MAASVRGWLVDTNVISELRKGRRCSPNVRAWSEHVPPAACHISQVSLAEIRFGIERVDDPDFRAELEAWLLDGVLPWFGARILEVDAAVLTQWCHLAAEGRKARYTYAQPDVLLAATALVHRLGVATRNVEDFVRAGVRIVNPWEADPARARDAAP
jgi:predicted nucleic acid-binding protein